MKKFNRREKTILRMMFFVIVIWGVLELHELYIAKKQNLRDEIDTANEQIITYLGKLEGESPDGYLKRAERLEKNLKNARDRIILLPDEDKATRITRESITKKAEAAGVTLPSISVRRTEEVNEDSPLKEIRIYFAFDAELDELLTFFESFENEPYYMVIDTLSITARRNYRKRGRNRKGTNRKPRKALNGNAVISSLFQEDAEGREEDYRSRIILSPKKAANSEEEAPDAPKDTSPGKTSTGLARAADDAGEENDFIDDGSGDDARPNLGEKRPDTRGLPPSEDADETGSAAVPVKPVKLKPDARPLTETRSPKRQTRKSHGSNGQRDPAPKPKRRPKRSPSDTF
ncbi:hypothetical protein SCOR_19505 [Sulfidibacter corallicola]|uniref:Uncharacterized protein n=1 Tax=Sulfidibacter corallicola TaxID=2818388 RepID=A0A8A4TVH5_SULCO|nr:hypothetical protein [Sulfidibacter corallicola]QTD53367.1 hypothetical protein J3U87_13010 [Sulfidibacter corallicola]